MFIVRLAKLRLKLTQEWQKMSLVRSLFTFETRLQRALGLIGASGRPTRAPEVMGHLLNVGKGSDCSDCRT